MTAHDSSGKPPFRAFVRRHPPREPADLDAIGARRWFSASCCSVGVGHQRMRNITTTGEFIWTSCASVPRANRHEIGEHLGPKHLSFVPA